MVEFSKVSLLLSAACPFAWVLLSLYYDEKGRLTVPGYGLPSAGFGLLALFALVQTCLIAVLCAASIPYPEVQGAARVLHLLSLAAMTVFSMFSYMFAQSRLARLGVWLGPIGFVLLFIGWS